MAGTIRAQYPSSLLPVRVLCTARVSTDLILRAFGKGADGVLVVGCHFGECDFVNGNRYAQQLVAYLQDVLEVAGIERERLRIEFASAAEGERFRQIAYSMDQTIRKLGPSPLKTIPTTTAKPATTAGKVTK
jgi:coenzyme F420-reducing hydrogenase delta subunit